MVAYLSNDSWSAVATAAPYLLSSPTDTPYKPDDDAHTGIIPPDIDTSITKRLLSDISVTLLCRVDIYVDDFIALAQVRPTDQRRVVEHVFYAIKNVFRSNEPGKHTPQETA